jgi:hypothetical protein
MTSPLRCLKRSDNGLQGTKSVKWIRESGNGIIGWVSDRDMAPGVLRKEKEEKPKGKKAKIDKDKGKDVKVEREEVKKKLVKFPAEGEYLTAT